MILVFWGFWFCCSCVFGGCGCLFFGVFLFVGVWCLVGACFVGLCWCVGVPGFLPSIEVALTL